MTDKQPLKKKEPGARPAFNGVVYRQPDKIIDAATGRTLLIDAILKKDRVKIERLLKSGANPGKCDKYGRTPLHYAARLSQVETASLLLKHGALINARDKSLATPLFEVGEGPLACDTLEFFLKNGANADIPDSKNRVPLHVVAGKSGKEVVLRLAEAMENPGRPDKTGVTPMHMACQKGGLDAVQALLAARVPIFCATNEGDTPLHFAAARAESAVAEYLLTIEAAQLVNAVNLNGQTPLHLAVKGGNVALVQKMLKVGADANRPDKSGESALHIAADSGNEEMVRLLIREGGADVSKAPDGGRNSPLLRAVGSRNLSMIKLLLEHDADPNQTGYGELTPLLMAVHMHDTASIEMLLKAGANPNFVNQRGQAILLHACEANLEKAVTMMLEHKADPNVKGPAGKTALHILTDDGPANLTLISLLLEKGADPLAKDWAGSTPFDLAHNRGRTAVVDLFKKKLAEKGIQYTPKKPPRFPPGWA